MVGKLQRQQILELRVEETLRVILRVLGPELARLPVMKPLVESVVLVRDIERRMTGVEGE